MIDLTGLDTRPAQTWGAMRLVPLVRREPIEDLRLHAKVYGDEAGMVLLPDRTLYTAYVPHAFVASWTGDGTPAAAYGTQLGQPLRHVGVRTRRRMARRVDTNRLRFLPLHLAVEGFLALHFGGPEIAWEEWSRQAIAHGLSPRAEDAYTGAEVRGLDDALKVFEIYPGQCGLLLYAGDTLASAFVVPHPEDYRALHPTLIRDLYGELIYEYALFYPARDFPAAIDESAVSSLADLRAEAERHEREWAGFHDSVMAAGLLRAPARVEEVYRMGPYTLSRFLPSFQRKSENHIGETITGADGRTAYLKTFRLSEAQSRRGHLLSELAAHGWNLAATAATLRISVPLLAARLERSGFGHLLRQDVMDAYRKQLNERTRRTRRGGAASPPA
ncbi:ARPP-2 domain-containing protein [Nonomuraea rubra]|uniref:ARPP-2 domain-containing protein n=1 Tax=Nonomuraea rubra TaxID=46180 RepID=UPI0033E47B39